MTMVFRWQLSGAGQVLVEGRTAPIVGRISMDQMQIDLTDIPGASIGAEVLLYGTHNGHTLRPEQVSQMAGTIPYELADAAGRKSAQDLHRTVSGAMLVFECRLKFLPTFPPLSTDSD